MQRNLFKKSVLGFTLIELLVVVAIIAFLSVVIAISYSRAQMRSRDSKRIADLALVKMALEIYRNDKNSFPPNHCYTGNAFCKFPYDPTTKQPTTNDGSGKYILQELIDGKYIDRIPQSPLEGGSGTPSVYYYWTADDATTPSIVYLITALESYSSSTGYKDSYRTSGGVATVPSESRYYCSNNTADALHDYCLQIKK